MTRPQDAALLALLEAQCRDLMIVLTRLETARYSLVPGPAGFWRGAARHAYDAAVDGIAATMDAGIAAVRSARDRTDSALREVAARV